MIKYIDLVWLIVAIQAQAGLPNEQKPFQLGFLSDILFPIKSSPWKFQMEGAKAQDRRSGGKKWSPRFWHLKHRKYCQITADLAPGVPCDLENIFIYKFFRGPFFIAKWKPSQLPAAHCARHDNYDGKSRFSRKKERTVEGLGMRGVHYYTHPSFRAQQYVFILNFKYGRIKNKSRSIRCNGEKAYHQHRKVKYDNWNFRLAKNSN